MSGDPLEHVENMSEAELIAAVKKNHPEFRGTADEAYDIYFDDMDKEF